MPAAKTKAAPKGRVTSQYLETALPQDELLKIPYIGSSPVVTVLGVDKVEGAGMGQFINRWRYVLTWTE